MWGRLATALRLRHLSLVVALFAGLTLLFYWEIALPSRILADYDVWTYFYPLRTYAAQAIQSGRFPLWNPDTFLGSPFFANPQTALLYPGSALFYVLPVPYAYSLSVLLHVFLVGVLTYAFLRQVFEVRSIGALVGAVAFAYGGFVSAQIGHINQLSATAWLPAIALAADLAVRRRSARWAVAGAAALATQLLAGHAQESYMTLWVVLVIVMWHLVSSGLPAVKGLPSGLVLCGLGFGLAAIQILPTAELSGQSIRAGGLSYEEGSSFSLLPPVLARSLMPGYWYNLFSEYIGYIGGVGLGFAAIALLFGRGKQTACAAMLATLGLFFALGGSNPLYPALFHVVPGLDLFRVPARWLCVYSFGAASLAALGVDWALRNCNLRHSAATATAPPAPGAAPTEASLSPAHRAAHGIRLVGVGLILVAAVWLAIPSMRSVPGSMAVLWLAAVEGAGLLTLLAIRRPTRLVAALILVAALAELRAAALDLPPRHAVPMVALDEAGKIETYSGLVERGQLAPLEATSPVETYLQATTRTKRILSIAPTEYESQQHREIAARYPWLTLTAAFNLSSALKLDAVMSPNTPLRYGLSTADGYDGGVLPLRRYLDLASLLIPRSEVRADGVLRTRLIAIPEERYLDLLGVEAIIANQVVDPEIDGVRYDVATARTVQPGQALRVDLPVHPGRPSFPPQTAPTPPGLALSAITLLSSVANLPPSAAPEVRMILLRTDGSRDVVPLRLGREIFDEVRPGPRNTRQPTAGPSREGRFDTAVRIEVPPGGPVAALAWEWPGPGSWTLRAATALAEDGQAEQLVLQPSLRRITFPELKVYERDLDQATLVDAAPEAVRLVPRAEVADDRAALDSLHASSVDRLKEVVMIAPETVGTQGGSATVGRPDAPPSGAGSASASVWRLEREQSAAERLTYRVIAGDGSGYLVVRDAWFPGWRAQVDGQEAPVYRANVYFKAVWVPAGAQTIVLTYDPGSVLLGAMISLLSMAVAAGLFLRGRIV